MAAIDRSIERNQARLKAGISDEVALLLQTIDEQTADKTAHTESLCWAIAKLVEHGESESAGHRKLIADLARQAAFWSLDLANDVNASLEGVGCNSPIGGLQ